VAKLDKRADITEPEKYGSKRKAHIIMVRPSKNAPKWAVATDLDEDETVPDNVLISHSQTVIFLYWVGKKEGLVQ